MSHMLDLKARFHGNKQVLL